MNLTALQKRKLTQFQDDIAFLEKRLKTESLLKNVRLGWIITMLIYISRFLVNLVTDGETIPQFIEAYGWKKILFDAAWWIGFNYFFTRIGLNQDLKLRRKELAAYEAKLQKETIA